MALCARLAIPRPILRTFHYSVPRHLVPLVRAGVRCLAPFGQTQVVGFVIGLEAPEGEGTLREITEVLDSEPVIPLELLQLGLWLSAFYHYPPGEALASLLPPGTRAVARPLYRPIGDLSGHLRPGSPSARLWATSGSCLGVDPKHLTGEKLSTFKALLAAGLLVREWKISRPKRPSGETWYTLSSDAPDPALLSVGARRSRELLLALREGPVSRAELRRRGLSGAVLRRGVERGWIQHGEEAAVPRDLAAYAFGGEDTGFPLTSDQTQAVNAITSDFGRMEFRAFLLRGVTGSGKTEVYIRVVADAVRRGLGAIILVPEISLTPQFIGRFLKHFGEGVAVLHSGLGPRERVLQWGRVRSGAAQVVIGARSAVLAPVAKLGLVIVDEEHESSYKQDEGLRYNAKHVALQRARMSGAVALLGSATPDVETYWGALTGKYVLLELKKRVLSAKDPDVRIVDLRQEERRRNARVLLSEPLRRAVSEALGRGEQALLFLNRRGFSPAVTCSDCGEALQCPHCSVAFTLHRESKGSCGHLLCHYCSTLRELPAVCPTCHRPGLSLLGVGTQRLTEAAHQVWPEARILRLDRDAGGNQAAAEVLNRFHRGEADILAGTQMVAKGHHFPRLTVVGVVDADLSLHLPDFRSTERTFQLLTQVAGRAGRAERPGTVFLQTRNPNHPVLEAVVRGDYDSFARAEVEARREAGFPPFRRLALLGISSPSEAEAKRFADVLATESRGLAMPRKVEVLGPFPAPIGRVRGRFRFQVLLRAPGPAPGPVQDLLRALLPRKCCTPNGSVRLHVDVDPLSML